MKILYKKLLELLGEIPQIKWVDLDRGQFDLSDRPPVQFPCALIEIGLPQCSDLGAKKQQCVARFTIRIGINVLENTSANTPEARLDAALAYFDLADQVYAKLQGYYDRKFGTFTRKSVTQERRPDGLKVMSIPFETVFTDVTAV